MLESRTGDSRNDVGVRPGGIVRQGDLEIGSLAGDMSLYLAAPPAEREVKRAGSELGLKSVRPGSSSSDGAGGHSSAVESIGWFDGFGLWGRVKVSEWGEWGLFRFFAVYNRERGGKGKTVIFRSVCCVLEGCG